MARKSTRKHLSITKYTDTPITFQSEENSCRSSNSTNKPPITGICQINFQSFYTRANDTHFPSITSLHNRFEILTRSTKLEEQLEPTVVSVHDIIVRSYAATTRLLTDQIWKKRLQNYDTLLETRRERQSEKENRIEYDYEDRRPSTIDHHRSPSPPQPGEWRS